MDTITHHDIPLQASAAATLQSLESQATDPPHQADPATGPVLHMLVRATRPRRVLLIADDPLYSLIWIALGIDGDDGEVVVITEAEGSEIENVCQQVGASVALTIDRNDAIDRGGLGEEPLDFVLLDLNATRYASLWHALRDRLAQQSMFVAVGAVQQAERLDALRRDMDSTPDWRHAVVDKGRGLLVAARTERPRQYEEGPVEAFTALMLQAVHPENLILGHDVVFDGAMKPHGTKVNFSGTGGQVGAGNLLITHPSELQRYTPQAGAVALVLGELPEPIRTPNVVLPLGQTEVVTLVVR